MPRLVRARSEEAGAWVLLRKRRRSFATRRESLARTADWSWRDRRRVEARRLSWDSWAGSQERGDVERVEAAGDAGEGVAEAVQGLGLAARGAGAAEVAAEGLARAVEGLEGGRGGGLVLDHALGLGDEAGVDVVDLQESVVDVAGGGRRGDRGDGVADAADVGLDALQRGGADGGALRRSRGGRCRRGRARPCARSGPR